MGRSDPDSIIAIHGLATESPRTWEFKKKGGGGVVNWLSDAGMLPRVVPEARIFTYDWDANCFEDAPVKTLLGHADTLLHLVAESRDSETRPIIFVASCFGGLILAEVLQICTELYLVQKTDILSRLSHERYRKAASTAGFYSRQSESYSLPPHSVVAMRPNLLSGQ